MATTEDSMSPVNGALLESHEYRIQRVEGQTSDLVAAAAGTNVKLETISHTLQNIDGKLDDFTSVFKEHKEADDKVHLKVHDLEGESKARKEGAKNHQYAFWTAIAAIASDLVMHLIEHLPKIVGH